MVSRGYETIVGCLVLGDGDQLFDITPSMLTHSLQKFCLVEGLLHFEQYALPQLLQVVRLSVFFPQISQVFFFWLINHLFLFILI